MHVPNPNLDQYLCKKHSEFNIFCDPAPAATTTTPLLRPIKPLCLLEPPNATNLTDGTRRLNPEPGINIFFTYFNLAWPWLIGSAAGFAVLQAIVGGMQMMLSGGGEQRSAGQTRITWALAGLVLVGLAGLILRILNPMFFS